MRNRQSRSRRRNKGQSWSLDGLMAMGIMVIGIIVFVGYVTDSGPEKREELDNLVESAKAISDALMTTGVPVNWTDDTVIQPGILEERRIFSSTKVNQAEQLFLNNYSFIKSRFGIPHDTLIVFENATGSSISIGGVTEMGEPGMTETDLLDDPPENLAKIYRFGLYDQRIVRMAVYVW